jgi:integrase
VTIYPEKHRGDYTGVWIVEVEKQGKRTRRRAPDRKTARAIEVHLLHGIEPLEEAPRRGPTLADLNRKAPLIWEGRDTASTSARHLNHAVQAIGPNTPLTAIDYPMLDAYGRKLKNSVSRYGKPFDAKTVNRYLAAVSKALSYAVMHKMLTARPMVPKYSEGRGRIAVLQDYDHAGFVGWLRVNAGPDVALCAEVLAVTGMRVSELLSLTPRNLRPEWIALYPAQTKTDEGRDVPLPGDLQEPLRDLMDRGFPHYRVIWRAFKSASRALGLADTVTPHVLRHTTATRLTMAGVPTAEVMAYLGHRSVSTTMKYAHVQRASLQRASTRLKLRGNWRGEEILVPAEEQGQPEGQILCSPLRSHSATRPHEEEK